MLSFRKHVVVILGTIGKGAYASVYRVLDVKREIVYAVKRLKLAKDDGDVPAYVLREIAVLKALGYHPNITHLLDVAIHPQWHACDLLLSYVPQNLHQLQGHKPLPYYDLKDYTRQLLAAVAHCHKLNVLHRDIKPQNILIDAATHRLQLCDFGISRLHRGGRTSDRNLTNEVVTRWYRPPEVLLGASRYGGEVDMWSVGCVVVEMATGHPLFPGDSDIDTLHRIFQQRGTPTPHLWPGVQHYPHYRDTFPKWTSPKALPANVAKHYALRVLVTGLLCMIPSQRLSATLAQKLRFCQRWSGVQ